MYDGNDSSEQEQPHPLARYLIEKIYTWDRHFGPLKKNDYDSVAIEINSFLKQIGDDKERKV